MGLKERSEQRRKKIVTNVAHSHEEAEEWDLRFWQERTPQERLSALVATHRDIEKVTQGRREQPTTDHRPHREDGRTVNQVKRLREK